MKLIAWAGMTVVLAVILDRVVLYLWSTQVIRFYDAVRSCGPVMPHGPTEDRIGEARVCEPVWGLGPENEMWPVRLMEVKTDWWLVQPGGVTVDGIGGLHLVFYPPASAWSTRVWPQRVNSAYFDEKRYLPKMYYVYEITVEPEKDGTFRVELYHGLQHNKTPLRAEKIRPQ
jgi:hypothetical protein